MNDKKYLDDLAEIKNLMNRSSRFLSLSGLSGIMAGIFALIGAGLAYFYYLPKGDNYLTLHSGDFKMILVILASVLILSLVTAYVLSARRAKQTGEKLWDPTTRRFLVNFMVPLITGGIYILIKLNSQHYGLTASLMLIFYGLALVNASKYTLSNVQYLGYAEIVLGLICAAFPGNGLWFWAVGFGVLHIIYGAAMYRSEKRS